MGEEVEALEDHADLGPLGADLRVLQLVEPVAGLPVAHELAVDGQLAAVDLLQVVDAPQEGALAGAGRADEAQHLAPADGQVDALQDLEPAEGLAYTARAATMGSPASAGARDGCQSWGATQGASASAGTGRTRLRPNEALNCWKGVGGSCRLDPRA